MERTGHVALRFHKLMEVGLDEAKPLFDTAFDISTTFANISQDWMAASELARVMVPQR
jgi:hypothetical protein